ncbi:MAG: hypothetical protein ACKOLA_06870, partial [Spartobacteria bacterium]
MRAIVLVIFILLGPLVRAQVAPPPHDGPVVVETSFYLVNLTSVDEKAETFDADIYLEFSWRDDRLAHTSGERLIYAEDAVTDKLKEIWWPQLEFVNASKPEITNQTLEIKKDGEVVLNYGLSSTFRASLDLHRFPFDRQTLSVRVESFLSDSTELVFRVNKTKTGFEESNNFEGLRVTGVDADVGSVTVHGWEQEFSEYRANIHVQRSSAFYIWTVFGPVVLIFMICSTVHVVPAEQLADRVQICLTALLACVATQFTLSFSLPRISYLTLIDRLFIATYALIALNVLVSAVEAVTGG